MIVEAERAVARAIDGQARGLVQHQRLGVEKEDVFLQHDARILATRARGWKALAAAALVVAAPAQAQLCDDRNAPVAADGRALGHLPYGDVAPGELASVAAEMAVSACALRREVLPDLERLLAAAGGQVLALSCHRSIARQQAVFCAERATAADTRALSVAPPGHSEHATGYALDFAFRPRLNGCADAEGCVVANPGFRWLVANASRFGFEMSFPAGNAQGVKWEPWHWRWVGASAGAPGAARARALFARARRDFPAQPSVDPVPRVVAIAALPAPPVYLHAIPAPECRRGKCRAPKRKR
ncbi:M15 family metallopeptidase [Sphingomonas sp. 36D10-4-7]|uniref:M15 family metallopeptidase n=1 Tax=Sphingomonas corticis TaxID=2722791 RepID=A0ABX1CSU8_9SPHN|nr:M15 family metallopeptidase [Sphingomonas corticis]